VRVFRFVGYSTTFASVISSAVELTNMPGCFCSSLLRMSSAESVWRISVGRPRSSEPCLRRWRLVWRGSGSLPGGLARLDLAHVVAESLHRIEG
jgi:hypothetical protein